MRVYELLRYHNNIINNIQFRYYIGISYASILYYNNYYNYECITIPGHGAEFVLFYDNYLLRAWQANCTLPAKSVAGADWMKMVIFVLMSREK